MLYCVILWNKPSLVLIWGNTFCLQLILTVYSSSPTNLKNHRKDELMFLEDHLYSVINLGCGLPRQTWTFMQCGGGGKGTAHPRWNLLLIAKHGRWSIAHHSHSLGLFGMRTSPWLTHNDLHAWKSRHRMRPVNKWSVAWAEEGWSIKMSQKCCNISRTATGSMWWMLWLLRGGSTSYYTQEFTYCSAINYSELIQE